VSVIRFACKKTIEERILELNVQKKQLIRKTFEYNEEERKDQNVQNMMHMMKDFNEIEVE